MSYQIVRILYTSIAAESFSEEDLLRLLTSARQSNQRVGITGVLLHEERVFAQWFEGKPEDVDTLWQRIQHDGRHSNIELIEHRVMPRRYFGQWQMGFVSAHPRQVQRLDGVAWAAVSGLTRVYQDPDQLMDLFEQIAQGNVDQVEESEYAFSREQHMRQA